MSEKRQDVPGPLIVGLGGTGRPASSTERALRIALAAAERMGARTICFGGEALNALPHYGEHRVRNAEEVELLDAVRAADGILLASPGYHGGVSGLVKNALDLLEDLRNDVRPYLHDRPVGCITTAYGWQACGSTLSALRAIVHALRGWNTPFGAALNVSGGVFHADGRCLDPNVESQLHTVAAQVIRFITPA